MSVRVEYGAVALNAKETFTINAQNINAISNPQALKESIKIDNFGNPCDPYSVLLDGSLLPLRKDAEVGIWSDKLSDGEGTLEQPVIITLQADELFTSTGISLDFGKTGTYASEVLIEWWRNSTKIREKTFTPDRPNYYCQELVDYYNKVVITLKKVNLPNGRLRLQGIEHGLNITFEGRELKSVKVTQELDSISTKLPISTCDIVINSDGEYLFQEQQPLKVFFNDELISTAFIKSSQRNTVTSWQVQGEDLIGILEESNFAGGIYWRKNARDLLAEIFAKAKVKYNISQDVGAEYVSGYIPYTSCREALKQVLFAIGAIVDTSYSETINVYYLEGTPKEQIPLARLLQKTKQDNKKSATAVEITSHQYTPIYDTINAYEAEKSGTGDGIMIRFTEPLHDLEIMDGDIIESETNYAVINAYEGCILYGQKYEDSKTIKVKRNPLVLGTDLENVVAIKDATLVSNENVDKLLNLCYNYYTNNSSFTARIVERAKDTRTKIGDYITCETEYGNNFMGTIEKQSYSLNGGILVKDTTIKKG